MKFSTKAIHHGQAPDKETGAVIRPIYMTSTYLHQAPSVHQGYEYTRLGNPNFTQFEETMAALEQGQYATVFGSGLGATTALISVLEKGDEIVVGDDLYAGTSRLFDEVLGKFEIAFSKIDIQNLGEVEKKLRTEPRLIFLESPSNPLLKICDIKAICAIAKKYGVLVLVDNTFSTPYFQNPLNLGADIVMHSTTKYLGGHSDVVGGIIVTNNVELKEKMDFARMSMGLNPSPFDVWLTNRGMRTLALRMDKHEKNAMQIAQFLENHPKVKKVFYPGLASHPSYTIAKEQMRGFSGVVSVEFDLSEEKTKELVSSFQFFLLAESLGGVESLVEHPATMTHTSLIDKGEITTSLVRFSIGVEDISDLLADLERGLKHI